MNKILTLVTVLFLLSASTTIAQELCDSYHDKYRVCVEAGEAGSNLDIADCATYTDETACNNADCFWNDQGLPFPGTCVVDICLADSNLSGRVSGADLTVLKRDLGRMDCETTPDVPAPAPVEKTGQTTSYATGDDGDLEKGVAWPNPRFTDNGDGTVTDNLTGLIWLKNANCFGTRSWNNALSDSNGLSSGSCGLTDGSNSGDWRLPNKRELISITHDGYYGPSLPDTAGTGNWSQGDPFNNVQSDYYWSATTNASSTNYAWSVHMYYGYVYEAYKTNYYYVWPVRGGMLENTTTTIPASVCTPCEGTLSALGRWCDQGDGTVKDMTTGLVWLKKADWGGMYPLWADFGSTDAHHRAAQLWDGSTYEGTAGLSDGSDEGEWRLPTMTQLVGITDGNEYIRDNQMYFFTGVQSYFYWSGTSYAPNPHGAWWVSMYGGYWNNDNKDNPYYVWPVRSDN